MLTSLALLLVARGPMTAGPTITLTLGNKKTIVIAVDAKGSPKTAAHILALVGKKFYDGQVFHRVEPWVVQWGDPESKKGINTPGLGNGGSGKNMPFETSKISFMKGVVGIASTGSKVGGDSQLFILTQDTPRLDGSYAVLGKVVSGMDEVMKIKRGDKIVSMRAKGKMQKASSGKTTKK